LALGVSLAMVAAIGCGAAEPDTLRAQAAQDFACPSSEVRAVKLDALDSETTRYRVDGCGRSADYVCTTTVEQDGAGRRHARDWMTRCRLRAARSE
jgi:hypothetical protein